MRDFARTPEPGVAAPPIQRNDEALTFVVQKHRATRLHYDLRLEVDGAMPSWPIPRGPSTDPAEKRLAVMTEPHPLPYATFEGVIPKGEYGAGEVIVWDRGTYSPEAEGSARRLVFDDRAEANARMRAAIAAGEVKVTLRGERMKGSWALVKTAQAPDSWLLIKHRDEATDGRDLTALDTSVISGLTIADLQAGRLLPQQTPRTAAPAPLLAGDLPRARRAALPTRLEPMQATLTQGPFDDPAWLFEPKLDGVRAIARLEGGAGGPAPTVRLTSRRGLEMTAQYPLVAAAVGRQPAHTLVLDGEIVAFDDAGVPSFERLQRRINLVNPIEIRQADRDIPVVYYVFDLLYLDGVDLRRAPLEARRALLHRTLLPTPQLRLVEAFDVDGETAYEAAAALGLEGLVAKRRDSTYDSGSRSQAWLKVKRRLTDEFVVVGYTAGLNSRASTFGALAIATRAGRDGSGASGALVSVGRVGSGFDDATLRALLKRLRAMTVAAPPLAVTAEQAAGVTWVRPELVVEVEYAERTSDGNLRAPVFMRVRDDKPAAAVRVVAAVPPPAQSPATSARGLDAEVASALAQIEAAKKQTTLEVGGARLAVTNLDKVMWPAVEGPGVGGQRALTKRDLLAYYARMAPFLLPHLRDRPLTMTRYPNGLNGAFFYQKHVEALPGDFVRTVPVFTEDGDQDYIVVNNLPTLLWLAQVADLALHVSLARIAPGPGEDGAGVSTDFGGSKARIERSLLNRPDFVLFDLDPYIYRGDEGTGAEPELNRRAFEQTTEVARWLKALLDSAGLSSFVKTSGATGLHIFVPVTRRYEYDIVREVAQTFGGFLVRAHPAEVTIEWATEKRRGKVFFDANKNARVKNLAAAYSPRAKPGAPVSMPLRWDELGKVYPTDFTILTAHDRVTKTGDLWAHILDAKHDLSTLLG